MPAVSDWAAPNVFTLTNPYNGTMTFNEQTSSGLYLLDNKVCNFGISTRVTKDNIPQFNGSILHERFLTGTEMLLSIQLWESDEKPACDDVLQVMLDELSGALRSLLNAGDNEGRLAWEIPTGGPVRMLDDIRLLIYPVSKISDTPALTTVTVTVDSAYPYAQDLTQQSTAVADGATVAIDNTGTAGYYPVYRVGPAASGFVITLNGTDLITAVGTIDPGDFIEIDTFKGTMFLNGDEDDELDNLTIVNTKFSALEPGSNTVHIDGADTDVLWAPAWG